MRFWDASALVPLCVDEASTAGLRRLATASNLIVWCMSAVEVASAIERRSREGDLDAAGRTQALDQLVELQRCCVHVNALGPVRERAQRLLAAHPLRAADAVQLGAALIAVSERPSGREFVCLDRRLREAAQREGFTVLPEEAASPSV